MEKQAKWISDYPRLAPDVSDFEQSFFQLLFSNPGSQTSVVARRAPPRSLTPLGF